MKDKLKSVDNGTWVRTVVLIFALVNQALVISGRDILPFSEESVGEFVALVITGVASLVAWWKNNSFTPEAKQADEYLDELRAEDTE